MPMPCSVILGIHTAHRWILQMDRQQPLQCLLCDSPHLVPSLRKSSPHADSNTRAWQRPMQVTCFPPQAPKSCMAFLDPLEGIYPLPSPGLTQFKRGSPPKWQPSPASKARYQHQLATSPLGCTCSDTVSAALLQGGPPNLKISNFYLN